MNLKTGEKIALIGAVITVIGSILPWADTVFATTYGFEVDGIFTLIFGIIAVLLVSLASWDSKSKLGTIVLGLLVTFFGVYYVFDPISAIGIYVTLIGGVILIISGIVGFMSDDSQQK